MKKTLMGVFFLSLFIFSTAVNADEKKHEIWINNLAAVSLEAKSAIPPTFGASTVNFLNGASVSFGHFITPNLEVVLSPYLNYISTAQIMAWSAQVGVNYSFSDEVINSFYAQAQVGYGGLSFGVFGKNDLSGLNTSGLIWSVTAGKRFKLADEVSFAPNLAYMNSASTGSAMGYLVIVPLQFSILL